MNKKTFWRSKTFWGLVIMTVGIWVPEYTNRLQGSVDDVIQVIGLVVALYGRWTAKVPLAIASDNNQDNIQIGGML